MVFQDNMLFERIQENLQYIKNTQIFKNSIKYLNSSRLNNFILRHFGQDTFSKLYNQDLSFKQNIVNYVYLILAYLCSYFNWKIVRTNNETLIEENLNYETDSQTSETCSQTSETCSQTSETCSQTSETCSQTSETNSKLSNQDDVDLNLESLDELDNLDNSNNLSDMNNLDEQINSEDKKNN
jgi:hypothetical protein